MTPLLIPLAVLVAQSAGLVPEDLTRWSRQPEARFAQTKAVATSEPRVPNAVQITVGDHRTEPIWMAELSETTRVPLKRGDGVVLSFWARSPSNSKVTAFVQRATAPYTGSFNEELNLRPEWRQYVVEGQMAEDYKPGEAKVGFHFNYGPGVVEIGAVKLTAAEKSTASRERPVNLVRNGDFSAPMVGTWDVNSVQAEVVPGGAPGGRNAWKLKVSPAAEASPWSHSVGQHNAGPIASGDVVYFRALMRSATRSRVGVMYERASEPFSKHLSALAVLTPEWKEYRFAAPMPRSFQPGAAQLTLFLGYGPGEVELANVRVENIGRADLGSLNITTDYYGGQANPDTWRRSAEQRIERIRKRDLAVRVLDSRGRPVPNATVRIEQTRHAFRFGTAAPAAMIAGTGPDADRFREHLSRLFNTVTFENDLKWNSLEEPNYANVDKSIAWLTARGFNIRAHNFVWGSQQYLPQGLWARSDQEVREAVERRIRTAGERFRGKVYLWDVVNEAVTEKGLWERLGWQEFVRTFKLAREADPKALLCYNDYNITEESQAGSGHRRTAVRRIKTILDGGGPLDVIGIQAHVGVPITPTARVLEILDDMGKLGPRLEITEYDLGVHDDKVNGQHMRDFLTATFSHPKVDGFIMWGFWEGAHWRAGEGGAMVRRNWTPRPAARAYEELVKGKWWTKSTLRTDRAGSARTRAFFGTHRVTVTANGKTNTQLVELKPGSKAVTLRL